VPTSAQLTQLAGKIAHRVCRHLVRKGWLEGEEDSAFLSVGTPNQLFGQGTRRNGAVKGRASPQGLPCDVHFFGPIALAARTGSGVELACQTISWFWFSRSGMTSIDGSRYCDLLVHGPSRRCIVLTSGRPTICALRGACLDSPK